MKNEIDFERVFEICRQQDRNVPLEEFTSPYEILVSTVMAARTNDDTTLAAAKRLFAQAPDFESLIKLSEEEIAKLIYPVGFYKAKAKNLKKLADQMLAEHNGIVPDTREELMSLSGVGRKTANLVLNRAFSKPAICVDTHVHYISNKLGWVNTKDPERTEYELEKILPEQYWNEINVYFVSLGRNMGTRKKLDQFLEEQGLIRKQ